MSVEFTDNSINLKALLDDKAKAFLYEAASEIQSQAKRNSRVKTGQLKGSWDYKVDESKGEAKIGSPLENAIWEEFGTGEYAVHGNGRKGGWRYQDDEGNWHFTVGKMPNHTLENAFTAKKNAIINRAKQIFGEIK